MNKYSICASLFYCVLLAACDIGPDKIIDDALCSDKIFRENDPQCLGREFDPARVCTTISGGGSTTQFASSACIGCSVSDPAKAIDNRFDTWAIIRIPAAAVAGPSFRAIAQDGIVYSAGNLAAAVLPNGEPRRFHILTYLDGTLQEDGTGKGASYMEGGRMTVAIKTTKPFDAVELKVDPANTGSEQAEEVLEFCSNTRLPP